MVQREGTETTRFYSCGLTGSRTSPKEYHENHGVLEARDYFRGPKRHRLPPALGPDGAERLARGPIRVG